MLSQRPDLANAHFDFQSSNGSIQVVSKSLSADDKSWLQGKLNSNADLVQAVRTFHDDAVAGYASWADADGSPLTQAQLDDVSKKADGLVGFLDLFKSLGSDAQQYQMKDGIYATSDGSPINLAQDPTTAAGFLAFNKSAQASANGTFSVTSNSGHVLYGAQLNIFATNSPAIPHFFPPSDTKTLGFKGRPRRWRPHLIGHLLPVAETETSSFKWLLSCKQWSAISEEREQQRMSPLIGE